MPRKNLLTRRKPLLCLLLILIGLAALQLKTPGLRVAGKSGLATAKPKDGQGAPTKADEATRSRLARAYGSLPLSFVANQGQTDARVKFYSRGQGYGLFLTQTEAVLALSKKSGPEAQTAVLRMGLVGANPESKIAGEDELPGRVNYFNGERADKWRADLSAYASVRYEDVYRGVDLVYYGNQRQLEYDFIVASGADPRLIKLAFQGARSARLNEQGDLVLKTEKSEVAFHSPVSYQLIDGERKDVESRYVLTSAGEVRFKTGDYDRTQPLIIDPVLVYSTYLGGSNNNSTVDETANGIAVDAAGNAYVTGTTTSTDFPLANPYKSSGGGFSDAFVSKLNAAGTALVYSTYLGGDRDDYGNGIAVDAQGAAYVVGESHSTNFPTTAGAFQTSGLDFDAFVTKLSPAGNTLVYSTLLNGERGTDSTGATLASSEAGYAVAVNAQGEAVVVGDTQSFNFPTANATQATRGGGFDIFVTKLNATGTGLVFSTYLGGSGQDSGRGVALDSTGNVYVTGSTYSKDFPTTAGAYKSTNGADGTDAIVAKFSPTGTSLYSTYVGGDSYDDADGIAVDSNGNAFIAGNTISNNFPVTQAALKKNLSKGAVFKSTNGGAGWVTTGLTNQFAVNAVAVDPTDASTVYAATDGGLFKTTNGGNTWSATGLSNVVVSAVAIDPNNSSKIFAGTAGQGIYKSTDGGANWTQPVTSGTINTFTFHPSDSSKVYAGTGNGGVPGSGAIASTDGGDTWTTFRAVQGAVRAIVFDPLTPSTIYMLINSSVSKSVDNGANWNTVLQSSQLNSLAIDPKNPLTLYATSFGFGLLKTTDGGANWGFFNNGLDSSQAISIAIDPVTPTTLYVGTYGNGVYISTNGGSSWAVSGLAYSYPNKLAIAPTNRSVIYAAALIYQSDIFIAGLNPTGSALVYSSYYGGTGYDKAFGIAIDSNNNLYITGTTGSIDFPLSQPVRSMNGIATEAFVVMLKGSDKSLVFSTYLGGNKPDQGNGIAVDASGSIYVAGITRSSDFPTASPLQSTLNQFFDPFVTKISAPTPNPYPLSGRVTDVNGNGISDVTLTVSGAQSGQIVTAQTDAQGNYSFNNTFGGDTLTPSKAGYIFSPSSVRAVSSNGITPITGTFNFTGGTAVYRISGQVVDGTGAPLSDVILTLTGSLQGQALTDAQGNYSFTTLFAGGSYTITPSKTAYSFLPSRATFNNISSNRTLTFVGTTHPYRISGQIKDAANNPLSGVAVNLTRAGGVETIVSLTDANGNYLFTNVAGEATYTVTPTKTGYLFSPPSVSFTNPAGNQVANFTATVAPVIQFSQASYSYNEAEPTGYAAITVTRTGDTSTAVRVDYTTSDQSGMTPCQTNNTGIASDRCDYATQAGTLRFAAGETQKTIQIPLIADAYIEPDEVFTVTLRNAVGASLGTSSATVTITDNKNIQPTINPIDGQAFFIKQQYIDFLGRVAEDAGFNFWMNRMNNCPAGQICDRIDTSLRFFQSDEFQERGFYVYRLYDAVLGRLPKYAEFVPDVARLNGFQTVTEQRQSKDAYLQEFINKAEFRSLYGQYLSADGSTALNPAGYVDALCQTSGITPARRAGLISDLQSGARTPWQILEDFILQPELSAVGSKFYDRGFITMQYFGYLRRDPEQAGFNFWQNQLIGVNAPHRGDYRFMVGGFLQSDEYRFRYAKISGGP